MFHITQHGFNRRVASLCYATDQGLGILAKAFYDNGIVTHPFVIIHAHHETHFEWYPRAPTVKIRPLDLNLIYQKLTEWRPNWLLCFETPFDWGILAGCRAKGIKTALITMYECTPPVLPQLPDMLICPSDLDYDYFVDYERKGVQVVRMPVPVDTLAVPWRQRTKVETFVHNAGNGSFRDRNGTAKLLEALRLVRSPARFILRMQDVSKYNLHAIGGMADRVDIRRGTQPYATLWSEGDAFVFPESFNGLSLPLQEARAAGMLVIATDRYPMTRWLPRESLIQPTGYQQAHISGAYNYFNEATIQPADIAAMIDRWYGSDVTEYSLAGRQWGQDNSWEQQGKRWVELLS